MAVRTMEKEQASTLKRELLILRVYETCPGHFFTLNP